MPGTHRSSAIHGTMPTSSIAEFNCTSSPQARAGLDIQGGDQQRGLQPIAPTLIASSKYSEVVLTGSSENDSFLSPGSAERSRAAHLLTLRSNYDYIKEGQAAKVGLRYPENLIVEANSTRINNKRAEKSRRERLSYAMGELALLLPHKVVTTARQICSRAETVEGAIRYIKDLEKEIHALRRQR